MGQQGESKETEEKSAHSPSHYSRGEVEGKGGGKEVGSELDVKESEVSKKEGMEEGKRQDPAQARRCPGCWEKAQQQ